MQHKSSKHIATSQGSTASKFIPRGNGPDLPWRIHYALVKRQITPSEFHLLAIVQAFKQYDPDSDTITGFFANNKYLAKELGTSVRWVFEAQRRLIGKGFLRRYRSGRFRYLEVVFSSNEKDGRVNRCFTRGVNRHFTHNKYRKHKEKGASNRGPYPACENEEGGAMLEAPKWETDSIPKVTDEDRARAKRLHKIANARGLIASSSKKEPMRFAIFRRKLEKVGKGNGYIDKMLDYLAEDPNAPDILGVRDLSENEKVRGWVEREMKKWQRNNVQITDDGKYVHREVAHLGWPPGQKDKLLQACQATFDNWQAMYDRTKPLPKKSYSMQEFCRSVGNVRNCAVRYMRHLCERLHTWQGAPAVTTLAWRHDSKMGKQFVSAVVGRHDAVKILEELYESPKA